MKKITLYVGLNDKDSKVQQISTIEAERIVCNIIATDNTIKQCKGVYTHEDGTITTENTLEVVLLDFDNRLDEGWIAGKASRIKQALNQESIAYEETVSNSKLI